MKSVTNVIIGEIIGSSGVMLFLYFLGYITEPELSITFLIGILFILPIEIVIFFVYGFVKNRINKVAGNKSEI